MIKHPIVRLLACLFLVCTAFLLSNTQQSHAALNPIQAENALLGTWKWQLVKPSVYGEIQAYTGESSINVGGTVHLYVSTLAADTYQIDIYRFGEYAGQGGRLMQSILGNASIAQGYYPSAGTIQSNPINCPTCITSLLDSKGQQTNITDANWLLSATISFSPSWISGIYEIKLTEAGGYQTSLPLVVRDDARPASFVMEDPLNTDQAYNYWGGTNFYRDYRDYGPKGVPTNGQPPYWAFTLSYNRPYTQQYGLGQFYYWTYSMVRYLERAGYDVTYTDNNAVAEGLTTLTNYKGFLVPGHDEYISQVERQKIEVALSAGVSLGYFSGNSMFNQIRTTPDTNGNPDRYIIEYKDNQNKTQQDPYDVVGNPNQSLTTTQYRVAPVNNPEDRVLKGMFEISAVSSGPENFVAANTTSWVYAGTGLVDGSTISNILGTEIDGYFPADMTSHDHITLIGISPFTAGTYNFTANAVLDEPDNTLGAIVFDAGTLYWPRGLSSYRASSQTPESIPLEQMTANILQKMITH